MPQLTRLEKATRARDRIAGVEKRLSVAGELWPGDGPRDVVAKMKAHLAALADVRAAEAALAGAIAKERRMNASVRALDQRLESYVRLTWGEAPAVLGDFGLVPHQKPGPKTT